MIDTHLLGAERGRPRPAARHAGATQAGRAWKMRGPRVFEPEWVARQLVHALRRDRTSFLAGSSNRLLLAIRRLSPAYARYIMRPIDLQAIARDAA